MKDMRRKTALILILGLILTSIPLSGSQVNAEILPELTGAVEALDIADATEIENIETEPDYVEGDVIVCMRAGGSAESYGNEEITNDRAGAVADLLDGAEDLMDVTEAVKESEEFIGADDAGDISNDKAASDEEYTLKFIHSDRYNTDQLIEMLGADPDVIFAEPNYISHPADTDEPARDDVLLNEDVLTDDNVLVNDTVLPDEILSNAADMGTPDLTDVQYAYGNGPGGIDVPDWNVKDNKNAENTVVAVLDSGVDYTNEDLKNVMWDEGLNYPTLTALGGGKYGINTGYDYYEGNHRTEKNDPMDLGGHGTHCAGIIAAEWNGIGISGAANGARIMAIKHDFNDEGSGSSVTSIKGFNYILAAKEAGVNVVAVNCSFGGPARTLALAYSAKELGEKGIVTCAASGNETEDIDIGSSSPSLFTGVPQLITVDSMDKEGKSSDFSNWGIRNTHLYAPGTGIISTMPMALPYPYPDEHISEPVKVSGNELAVSFDKEPSDNSPFKFNLTPADIDFSAGEMKIRNTERAPRVEDLYFGKAFSVSVNLPRPEEGKHYYLIFSKRVESDESFAFPVVANCRGGGRNFLSTNLSNTYRNFSYEIYKIDEEEFDIENLELEFYLYNPHGNDPAPEAAIGEMWITDVTYPYRFEEGTSMATPAVAGEAAILAKEFPEDSAAKRAARIVAGVKKVDDLSELCITGGAANVRNSLDESKYTPVINSISADEQHIYINGFFFGEQPDVSIEQGGRTWSSGSSLNISSIMTDPDGAGVIIIDFPGNGLIRDEEVKVTVTDMQKPSGRRSFSRIIPLYDNSEESTEDGSLYKRIPLSDAAKDTVSSAITLDSACLNGSIYYLCVDDVTDEEYSLRYQNGTFSKTEDPILYSGHIAQWNGMLVYADRDRLGDLIFHDGNRIVKRKEFVPDDTRVAENQRFDLYYDGRDLILIRGMTITDEQTGEPVEDISAVYRLDPYTCRGTFLGELKNVYGGGIVITHEEKTDSPNTFYIIGSGSDENGAGCEFLGEKFTVSPTFDSEVINSAAPLDFRFNPNEHWTGCGVKNGIYLTGAHTVKGDGNIKYIEADNYFYDYSDPSAGFVKCPKKISDMTVYHPLVNAYDNKVTFLAMNKEEYLMCTTDCETLPAYGDKEQAKRIVGLNADNDGDVPIGRSIKITPDFTEKDGKQITYSWSSEDGFIASVDQKGNVKGNSTGRTYIQAIGRDTAGNEYVGHCEVYVYTMATGIKLNAKSLYVSGGDEFTLRASLTPYDAIQDAVEWSISAPISHPGAVIKTGEGSDSDGAYATFKTEDVGEKIRVKVTARTMDGSNKKAACQVTIEPSKTGPVETVIPVKSAALSDTGSIFLGAGMQHEVSLVCVKPENSSEYTVEWKSSDPTAAAVSGNNTDAGKAVIKAGNSGKANITAVITNTAAGGIKTVNIKGLTVKIAQSDLSGNRIRIFNKKEDITDTLSGNRLPVGKNLALKTSVLSDNLELGTKSTKVIWSSSDPSVATAVNGKIKAYKEGEVTFTATLIPAVVPGGEAVTPVSAFCTFYVYNPIKKLSLNSKTLKLVSGSEFCLTPLSEVAPASEWDRIREEKEFDFASSDPSVVDVTETRGTYTYITPKKAGKAVITCKALDGSNKLVKCKVTVYERVTGVKITAKKLGKATVNTFNEEEITVRGLGLNKSFTIQPNIEPAAAFNKAVAYSSGNPSVLTVNSKGVVKRVGSGNAEIYVTTVDGGYTAVCHVVE